MYKGIRLHINQSGLLRLLSRIQGPRTARQRVQQNPSDQQHCMQSSCSLQSKEKKDFPNEQKQNFPPPWFLSFNISSEGKCIKTKSSLYTTIFHKDAQTESEGLEQDSPGGQTRSEQLPSSQVRLQIKNAAKNSIQQNGISPNTRSPRHTLSDLKEQAPDP